MALHKGDIGAIVRLTSESDLSSQTLLKLYYRKPVSGTTGNFTASLQGTGNVQYTTTAVTCIDEVGDWTFQAYSEITGFTGRSTSVVIPVAEAVGS